MTDTTPLKRRSISTYYTAQRLRRQLLTVPREDLRVDGNTNSNLKETVVEWIKVAHNAAQFLALVNAVMELGLLTASTGFTGGTLHGLLYRRNTHSLSSGLPFTPR
jgi:hypothetical protein